MSGEREEQFILRIQDLGLADKIRAILREDPAASKDPQLEIHFNEKGSGRSGTLVLDGETFPLVLQDLPTIVESYKTYDDMNLVKTADIGQVLVVGEPGGQQQGTECRDGVTPPMRDARRRMFANLPAFDPTVMRKLEEDLLTIAMGEAPAGMEFIDVEEEYVVDEDGHGEWQPVSERARQQQQEQQQQPSAGPPPRKARAPKAAKQARSSGSKHARSGSAGEDDPDVEEF